MQNTVPGQRALAREVADRTLAERRKTYAEEVRRLIDAAFAVMRDTADIDPNVRDIVRAAGLSNQAFYRHFPSKDSLFLAVLGDGQRQMTTYLRLRVGAVKPPREKVRVWIEGVMAQARDDRAAQATRPFAINGARLAERFPDEITAYRNELIDTLWPAVEALRGTRVAAVFICDLVLARMSDAIARRRRPGDEEIADLVAFCLAGVKARGA
jgi:AcrR family transcriptional regulator